MLKTLFGNTIKRRAYKSLKKDLSKKRFKHETVPFAAANTIALLIHPRNNDDLNKLLGLSIELEAIGKKINNLVYISTKKKQDIQKMKTDFPVINFLTGKDINWLDKPSGKSVDGFLKKEFDVLIDLSQKENFITTYLSAKSKARFRVGRYFEQETIGYDFMLDQKSGDLDDFIKQLKHYLTIIRNEAASVSS